VVVGGPDLVGRMASDAIIEKDEEMTTVCWEMFKTENGLSERFINLWNSLDEDIVCSATLNSFKN